MSNFDKMIKLIEEKDIKGMEEWLHPDFLFVVDYEMETREEWLKETKRLLDEDEFSILNIELLYEDDNVIVHQGKYDVEGIQRKHSKYHSSQRRATLEAVSQSISGRLNLLFYL